MNNSAVKDREIYEKIKKIYDEHYAETWTIAIDEVGRGSLFGPVTVGGVLFKSTELFTDELPIWNINVQDSKKIKQPLRLELSEKIKIQYIHHISHVSVKYIEKYNINGAIQYGVYRTVQALLNKGLKLNAKLSVPYLLLDGNYKFAYPRSGMSQPMPIIYSFIKGDEKLFHISCASIIAKEERDRLIKKSAARFSSYGLEKNIGYGTLQHRNSILENGITQFHRKEFIKKIVRV